MSKKTHTFIYTQSQKHDLDLTPIEFRFYPSVSFLSAGVRHISDQWRLARIAAHVCGVFFASVYPKVQLLHNLHLKLYRKKSPIILKVLSKFISKEKMVQCIFKKQNKNTQIKAFNAPNSKL